MSNVTTHMATSWWDLEETSGVRAWSWLTPNHGTYVGSPTRNGANGVVFNGTSQYVNVPDDPSLDVGTGAGTDPANDRWTLWARVKRGTIGASRAIISKGPGAPYLRLDSTGRPQVLLSGGTILATAPSALDTNPHTIMASRGGTFDVRIWVDGSLVVNTSPAGSPTGQNSQPLRIGADTSAGGAAQEFFNGTIYAAAIYDGEFAGGPALLPSVTYTPNQQNFLAIPALASWRDPADSSALAAQCAIYVAAGKAPAPTTVSTYVETITLDAAGKGTMTQTFTPAQNGVLRTGRLTADATVWDTYMYASWALARATPNIALGDNVASLADSWAMVAQPTLLPDTGAVFYRAMIGAGPTDYAPGSSWQPTAAAAQAQLPARGAFLAAQAQIVRMA